MVLYASTTISATDAPYCIEYHSTYMCVHNGITALEMYSLFGKSKHKFDYNSGHVVLRRDVTDESGSYCNDGFVSRLRNGHSDKPLNVFQEGHKSKLASVDPGEVLRLRSVSGTWKVEKVESKEVGCERCRHHKCCPARGAQGPEGPQGPPGQPGLQGVAGKDAVLTEQHISSIVSSLALLRNTHDNTRVSEGTLTSSGSVVVEIAGGTAVLVHATLVGGGGGGSSPIRIGSSDLLSGGDGGGGGHLVSGQFVVPTPVKLTFVVGSGGIGGMGIDDMGKDGSSTYIEDDKGNKYLHAYGGWSPSFKQGGSGYFGGGSCNTGGKGVIRNGYAKTGTESNGSGSGHNGGMSASGDVHAGCGGGSGPTYGKGGNGGTSANIAGCPGTFGGGGGGGYGGHAGHDIPVATGGKGGDGCITYCYKVF